MDSATTIIEANPPSEISWSAIIAGALVAIAVSLGLLILASALGLVIAPWFLSSTAAKLTAGAAIWLVIAQWASGAFGGYVAGRMRLRWTQLHPKETFFRDTAHGFLTWIVATLFVAAFTAAAIPAITHQGLHAAAMMSPPAMHGRGPRDAGPASEPGRHASLEDFNPFAYYTDMLYRGAKISNPDVRAETNRIIMKDMREDSFPDADKTYLAEQVSAQTGVSPGEAATRVNAVLDRIEADKLKMKTEADDARKAASTFAFITFLSMLIGAFIASVAAVLGGRQRDRHS